MRLVTVLLAVLFAVAIAPIVLIVAVALGPVSIGILAAVTFGLVIFVLESAAAGLAMASTYVERVARRSRQVGAVGRAHRP